VKVEGRSGMTDVLNGKVMGRQRQVWEGSGEVREGRGYEWEGRGKEWECRRRDWEGRGQE
jgi:hypothetical protein